MTAQTAQPDFLRVRDVAANLGFDRRRVYELVETGRIPATRLGPRTIVIPRLAFEAWRMELGDRAVENLRGAPAT